MTNPTVGAPLDDCVPYCVVKRNCNGPSFLTEKRTSRTGIRERWTCQHCGGFVLSPDHTTPPKPRKVEP
jgi:hypothetical protein